MHILLFFLILIIVIVVLGLSVVGAILRTIFGIGRRSTSRPKGSGYERTRQQPYNPNPNKDTYTSYENKEENVSENAPKKHKKIFNEDEGEYVDFEEIKK